MSSLTDLTDYYADLLAYEYRGLPNATRQMALWTKQAVADFLAQQLTICFDLDVAVGAQLDILGKYIGLSRNIGVPDDNTPYFGFQSSNSDTNNLNGFTDSTNIAINAQGVWYQSTFVGQANYALTDEAYRFMLRLKIAQNSNPETLASIQQTIYNTLRGFVALVDNKDMTLTYTLGQRMPPGITAATLANYLLRPMGVGINVQTLWVELIPMSISKTQYLTHAPSGPHVVTGVVNVVAHNATGFYNVVWDRISVTGTFLNVQPSSIFSAAPTFSGDAVSLGTTSVSVWRATVTDSLGLVASAEVAVTLNYLPDP